MESSKNKGAGVIIGLLLLVVVIAGVALMSSEDMSMTAVEQEGVMMEEPMMEGEEMEVGDAMVANDVMVKAGTYEPYSEEKLALAEDGKVVLYFSASWCPTCRALDADIVGNLSQIPEDVHILKIDYDSAVELRQKYGVTTQHTLVEVDAEGNQLSKWSGSLTLSALLDKLN